MKIDFEIGNKKYKIAGLTVGDWYHVKDEMLLNPHAQISITSYLSGCPEEELRSLPVDIWEMLWKNVENFLAEAYQTQVSVDKVLKHDGTTYAIIDFEGMSIGEFADLDVIISSPNAERRLHEMCAILLRPIVDGKPEPYDPISAKKRAESFLLLPLQVANKVTAFFLFSGLQYFDSTLDYLKLQSKSEKMPEQKEMLQTTHRLLQEAGIKLLSFLQTKESWSLKKSLNSESECASIGLRISRTKSENKSLNYKKLFPNINAN